MSEHHLVTPKTYGLIFGALMIGTALTVYVAQFSFGRWNILIAMTVACIKATLVVLFFMHAYYSSKLTKVVIGAGLFWFAILMLLTFADYSVRHDWHDGLGALERPGAAAPAPAAAPAGEHK
jgi:cytochrome c oxidase subunit 4